MDLMTVVLIAIGILIFLLMMSVPLPYCFGGALMFMGLFGNVSVKSLFVWSFGQLVNTTLLASPLFILAGTLMGGSGIAKALLDFVDIFIARIRGGLGVVSVVTCAIIGAISGSGFTGVAATGPIMIPRMVEQGYPRGFATALVTCSSILGLLIPPSVVMIMYGWVTETSILACFLSTVVPEQHRTDPAGWHDQPRVPVHPGCRRPHGDRQPVDRRRRDRLFRGGGTSRAA